MYKILLLTVMILVMLLISACYPLYYISDTLKNPRTQTPEASTVLTPPKEQVTPGPQPEQTPNWMRKEARYYNNAVAGEEYLNSGEWRKAASSYEYAIELAIEEGCSPQELTGLYLSLMRAYDMQGKTTRSLAVLLGARAQGAEYGPIDKQVANKLNELQLYTEEMTAYLSVLQSLLDQYGQYVPGTEDWEYPVGVFHADLPDLDRDGSHELLCIYGVPEQYTYTYDGAVYEDTHNIPYVELYAYRDGRAVRLLQERVGYYFAQSDEGKEVVLGGTNELWISFYPDSRDYCKAYYTVQNGNLISRVLRAYLPADESFDVDVDLYDIALGYEIDGRQVDRTAFEQERNRMGDMVYGPEGEPFEYIFIPPDTFWTYVYAKQIEAVMLFLGGRI